MQERVLTAGDYRLVLRPGQGGSIARFDWRGEPLFRPACGPSILDAACFPLVPFSNRIAYGRFDAHGVVVRLSPNFPGSEHPHPLHGFGWLAPWRTVDAGSAVAVLEHLHHADEWPWPYVARQVFTLAENGFNHEVSVTNLGNAPMPAGLGVHPYFPRTAATTYLGRHVAEWETGLDGLPITMRSAPTAIDWWAGRPVATRSVDTVYTGRVGPLQITWPDREMALVIAPCAALSHTVVFTPEDAGFFCVEPISHSTDAVNSRSSEELIKWLQPGEAFLVNVHYAARHLTKRCAAAVPDE